MHKATEIIAGYHNGKLVKFFTIQKLKGGAWVHVGRYIAPKEVAKKNLVKWWKENQR